MRESEFQKRETEIRTSILSGCNVAPELISINPVSFVTEWEEETGLGGLFRAGAEQVLAWKGGTGRSAESIAYEVFRLVLQDPGRAACLPERLASLLRYHQAAELLIDWFYDNARILRWRSNPLPYYVWVSEIMLQQTRVEAVKAYFDRFVDSLPDIRALAECPEEKLLKLWEGLGYYNRVRNLQKAASVIMEQYGGELPRSYEELQKLPGIGSYTAGAISSIAYGNPAPAVDGNVLRVTKRLAGSTDDITKSAVKKETERILYAVSGLAAELRKKPGDLNQAWMELGAVVCLPNGKPLCDRCPVEPLCLAAKEDSWKQIPVKPAKKGKRIEEKTVFLLEQGDGEKTRYGIRKREGKGLLAGLWELPNTEGNLDAGNARRFVEERFDATVLEIRELGEAKHIFSHVEWRMIGYAVRLTGQCTKIHMATERELEEEYSLPSAFEAYRPGKEVKKK